MTGIKLGLIGAGISKSRAPVLYRLASQLCGITVTYDLIEPASGDFAGALQTCRAEGYQGVNVTHPFKERAAEHVRISSPEIRRLGAVNTIRFDGAADPQGFNTDYTGFKRAFLSRFAGQSPGRVAITGAGGVGRAIAFALADLGAERIQLFDQQIAKAENLATVLRTQSGVAVEVCRSVEEAVAAADGLVNATPIGMYQHPGTPIPGHLIRDQRWAFDAVYTPAQTRFVLDATQAGLEVLGGYELFFHQGVDAFEIFTDVRVDEARLRAALAEPETAAKG